MAGARLTFTGCRNYQMLFLAPVWLIRDKFQQCGIVLLTPTHAKTGQCTPSEGSIRKISAYISDAADGVAFMLGSDDAVSVQD